MSAAPDSDWPLHKGQLFDSFDDFKLTLGDWAVQAKFSYRAKNVARQYSPKSVSRLFNVNRDRRRSHLLVICTSKQRNDMDCPFFVRAIWSKRKQSVIIGAVPFVS
jgi:hypothetical protein